MVEFCTHCNQYKDDNDFCNHWTTRCNDCKKKFLDDIQINKMKYRTEKVLANVEKNKAKYYANRYKCECGSYISDGNPKERHEATKGHKNYLEYVLKGGKESIKFLNNPWRIPND